MERLQLFSETFVWYEGTEVLCYNSNNGRSFHMQVKTQSLSSVLDNILNISNLYFVPLTIMEGEAAELKEFVIRIEELGMGRILRDGKEGFSLPPTLRILNDITHMKDEGIHTYNVLKYLQEIVIYIGGNHSESPLFRQVIYPINTPQELSVPDIDKFITQVGIDSHVKIRIVISSVTKDIDLLIQKLLNRQGYTEFCYSIESLSKMTDGFMEIMEKQVHVKVIISPDDTYRLQGMRVPLNPKYEYTFLVDSVDAIQNAKQIISNFGLDRYNMVGIWNDNIAFLKEQVFLSKKEIIESKPSKRVLFIHQSVNLNYWGKLILMPDKQIYSDIQGNAIGSMDEPISVMVQREMISGRSWTRTRDRIPNDKCPACLYKWLCPGFSPIESVSGYLACGERMLNTKKE